MNEIKPINYRGYTIDVFNDYCAISPDDYESKSEFIIYDHPDFSVDRNGFDGQTIFNKLQRRKLQTYKGYFVFRLYAYIHSGIKLSLSYSNFPDVRFDVSLRGFVFVKREKEDGKYITRITARERAASLVECWNQYLTGDVYGNYIKDPDGEIIDSIGSVYGLENCIKEAREQIDAYRAQDLKNHLQDLKQWITKRVPLLYRKPLAN